MSTQLYGLFTNGTLIEGPCSLPTFFITNDNRTITGFDLLETTDPDKLIALNWYKVNDPEITYNPDYESIVYSYWYLTTDNILTRDHTLVPHSFDNTLNIAYSKLINYKDNYLNRGFEYNYNGVDYIIESTDDNSFKKLLLSNSLSLEGSDLLTERIKLKDLNSGDYTYVEVPLYDIRNIINFILEKYENADQTVSVIYNQMIGCQNTETLKNSIINGTIVLNPWQTTDTLMFWEG